MSNHFINWARVQKAGGVAPKALLLVLADHANSKGICWPGIALLATTLECDEKTIRRNLNKLFKANLVFRLNKGNQNKNTTYLLAPYGPFQAIKEELSELDILPASQDSEVDILPASAFSNGEVNRTFCPSEVDISARAYIIKEPPKNPLREIQNPSSPPEPPKGDDVEIYQMNKTFFDSIFYYWDREVSEQYRSNTWGELDLERLLSYQLDLSSDLYKNAIGQTINQAHTNPKAYLFMTLDSLQADSLLKLKDY